MKRNSKQLLAILLSAVMTLAPAVPVMADEEVVQEQIPVSSSTTENTDAETIADAVGVVNETETEPVIESPEEGETTHKEVVSVDAESVEKSESMESETLVLTEEGKSVEKEDSTQTTDGEKEETTDTEQTDKSNEADEEKPAQDAEDEVTEESTTHAISVQVTNSEGKASGMYAMEQAVVTAQEDGTYLVRMHQKNANRNYMAIVPDTSETSKNLATKHAVSWYLGGGADGYWFVIRVNSLDDIIYASFSKTENVNAGKDWGNVQMIRLDAGSLADTEAAEVTAAEMNLLPAVAEQTSKTHAITVQVTNSEGKASGMYAMEDAVVTEQEDGTYLVRMHQKNANRNYMAIVPDTSETSKGLATKHAVDWYLGGGADGYSFVVPVHSLDDVIYASFSKTENVNAGKDWSNVQVIRLDAGSLADTEAAEVSKSEMQLLAAVQQEEKPDDQQGTGDKPKPDDSKGDVSKGDQQSGSNVPKDGNYEITADTGAGMFRVVNAELKVKNGKMTAIITLSGTGYDYLYAGTKAAAEKASASSYIPVLDHVSYVENGTKKTGARYEVPVSALDKALDFASHSINKNLWYARTITFSSGSLKALSAEKAVEVVPTGKNVSTKDASTAKSTSGSSQVGKYSFTWSGGSGRVNIILNSVSMEDGQAYATITFVNVSGRPASYDSVRVNGQTISGSNTFKIPVTLNKSMTIEGRTTAMSTPHWVAYQIFVGDGNGGAVSSTVAENVKTLDEKAPEITGLKFESETEFPYTNKVKMFNYDQGIKLIEIDMTVGTANEGAESTSADESKEEVAEKEARPGSETPAVDDNIENTNKANTSETNLDAERAALYRNPVVKYLIVPEDTDVPAGLDTQAVIIKLPVDKTLLASTEAMELLEKMDALDNVTALAIDPKEVTAEALKSDKILAAGTYDDWDLKGLIQAECNFAIESSKILPKKDASKEETEAAGELLQKYADRAVQMDMPVLIDRSADEENVLAAAEWYKIYGVIFGKESEAEKLYEEVVSKASDADKAAAVDALK